MTTVDGTIAEARAALSAGHEATAIELLSHAIDVTDDRRLLAEIHELAVETHAHAVGFHKLEWHRLVVESEPHAAPEHA